MKKILLTIGIIFMLISLSQVIPAIELENEDTIIDYEEILKWKVFFAIGLIDIGFNDDIIDGFVVIGYNAGDMIIFERVDIQIDGMPIVMTHTLFYTLCLYKPA